ncbi:MAG: Ig-like domain-containing protein, partial [Candidatus Pacearchaeota archaeon]
VSCNGYFEPAVNCTLTIDGNMINSSIINTAGNYSFDENVSDGEHSWSITCTDKAGWQTTSETRRLIIDTSAPKIELISPANNSYVKTNATFRWNASDLTNITCNLSIDGEINQTLAGSGGGAQSFLANVPGLAEGLHNWSVTCWDEFSHSNASETLYFEVDAQEPQVMIIQPSLNDSNNGSYSGVGSLTILFNFTASDNKATNLSCSYVVNGETSNVNLVNGSYYEFNKTFTRTGSYMWIVKCYDLAENEGSANASFSLTISSAGGSSSGGGGSRGGGGRSYYCSPSWQCSEWSACVNGKQTRSCVDLNNCGGIPPVTERSCEVNQTNQTVSESIKEGEEKGGGGEEGEGGMSVSGSEGIGITGGVVGALKKSWIPLVIIAGIVVIGYSFSLLLKLRKPPLASKIKFYKSIPQQL